MRTILCSILAVLLSGFFLTAGLAANDQTYEATYVVPMGYDQVLSMLDNQLQRCVARKAGLLSNGIKTVMITIGDDSIIHVNPYQLWDAVIGELGNILVSKGNRFTVVKVTDRPDITGYQLHLIRFVKYWLRGSKACTLDN